MGWVIAIGIWLLSFFVAVSVEGNHWAWCLGWCGACVAWLLVGALDERLP